MIIKLAMLFIGMFMGVTLMSILQVASDADDQMEEIMRRKQEDEKE